MSGQGFEQLTLFQAGFPASHLVLPGSDEARKMTATSGRKCCELCKSSSQLGSLVRTLLASSIWGSTRRYLIWKPRATKHGHLYFQLVPLTPPTDVIDAQLWATPNTMDYMPQRSPEALKRQAETTRKGRTRPANLREQVCEETVKLWPTPRANDAEKRGNISQDPRNGLPGAVLWPTPTTDSATQKKIQARRIATCNSCHNASDSTGEGWKGHDYDPAEQGERPRKGLTIIQDCEGFDSDAKSELRNGTEQLRDKTGVAGFADGMRRDAEPGLGGVVDGIPAWMDRYWVTEPDIPRLTTKKEHRVERLRALGNAVYWRQFYPIFRGIMEIETNSNRRLEDISWNL